LKQPAILIPEGCDKVLLHACCAPCSSAIVEWLMANGVRPTIFYFNPNIWPREEYEIRKNESKRHAGRLGLEWIDGDYDHEGWRTGVCGLENQPERGLRCEQCFTLRLAETARKAQELGFRYFATTLASSRWKSLEQIERAGQKAMAEVPGTVFWAQNWRKGGLQERRNQLLKENQFYNQQYCGCEFSARNGANTKPLLRAQMREAKKQHQAQLARLSEDIVRKLQGITASRDVQTVMAYWPLSDEVDIRPLVDQLAAQGVSVVLPKVTGDETMELRHYASREDLEEGAFHIMEPVGEPFIAFDQIDFALVPGMAFDAAGHRLGRGKGYYDRFLSAHPDIYKIGVCFPFQRVAEVSSEAHDVVMDEVIS
jgi:5,10-methenyltetrahydrofolate synthetase